MGKYTMKLFDCKSVRLWEKPLATSINRLRSRSTLFPFPDEQQAKKVSFEPFDCPQIMNLNGEWKFRCLACPEQVEEAFTGERFDDSGWDGSPFPATGPCRGMTSRIIRTFRCRGRTSLPSSRRRIRPVSTAHVRG